MNRSLLIAKYINAYLINLQEKIISILLLLCCCCCFTTVDDSFIGCFYDSYDPIRGTTKEALRILPDGHIASSNITIGTCIHYCAELQDNIRYAGLEAGHECWCGAEDTQYNQYGERDVSECSSPCSGNVNQTCGTDFRIAVYDRKLYLH